MYINKKNFVKEKNIFKKSSPSQKEKYTSVFYEETKITIILASILGTTPISPDKKGNPTFSWLSTITIYSLIIFGLASVNAWFVINLHIRVLKDAHDKIEFDDKIVFTAASLIQGLHFLPLLSFFESKKKVQHFMAWKYFEQKYNEITKKRLIIKMKHLQYMYFFGLLLISMFFIYFIIISTGRLEVKYKLNTLLGDKIAMAVLYFYYLSVMSSCLGDWIFLTLAIRKTAKVLLNDFKDLRLRSYFFDELYGLWLDLRYITEDFGNVFSGTYIYYLCYTFMMLMGSTYSFLANITALETENKYEYGGFALITAVAFWMIGDSAHRTINQLGNNFQQELLKILAKERDPTTIRGIKWFLETIALNSPVISLSGYVSLDRGFNVSMLGTLVTYIVVVLQFRTTSNQPTVPLLVSNTTSNPH